MTTPRVVHQTVTIRDRLAWAICHLALRWIATRRYRRFVSGAIEYGIRSAHRDTSTDATPPPPWRVTDCARR